MIALACVRVNLGCWSNGLRNSYSQARKVEGRPMSSWPSPRIHRRDRYPLHGLDGFPGTLAAAAFAHLSPSTRSCAFESAHG